MGGDRRSAVSQRGGPAFWVGLGGYAPRSKALEQIGSEADCSSHGQLFYYAWYELVPRPPVTIARLTITPGDSISASVHISSDHVTLTLTDNTTEALRFVKRTVMHSPAPDTSAAEWIAEAPASCSGNSNCRPLRLTNFGQIGFTAASASSIGTDGSHTGPIDDPVWDSGAILLSSNGHARYSVNEASYALPSSLSPGGAAFTVDAKFDMKAASKPAIRKPSGDGTDRTERADRAERPHRTERADRAERAERPDRHDVAIAGGGANGGAAAASDSLGRRWTARANRSG